MRALAFVALLCLWLPSHGEAIVHERTGIVFPDAIAGFKRIGYRDYEAEKPGLGVSCGYRSTSGVNATVYVYTAGLSRVPGELDHPLVARLREQTVREIVEFAEGRGESVRHTDRTIAQVHTAKGTVPVFFDGFVVDAPSGTRHTFAWLWSARGHFVKIRMTRLGGVAIDPNEERAFYEAVVRLAAE